MSKSILSFVFLITFQFSYSQFNYKKGIIVQTNGDTIQCEIKNKNWTNNPKFLNYKVSGELKKIFIKDLRRFEVYDVVKYINTRVLIDLSSNNVSQLSRERKLNYEEKNVLLKILFDGTKKLYQYKNNGIEKYFFSTAKEPITQLTFKRYAISRTPTGIGNDFIKENNDYQNQLRKFISCSSNQTIEPPSHNRNSLTKFFSKNSNCSNLNSSSNEPNIAKPETSSNTSFFIVVGANNSSIAATRNGFVGNQDDIIFDNQLHPLIGIGVKIAGSNNKFSAISELNYNFSFQTTNSSSDVEAAIDFDYAKLLFGGRFHINLSDKAIVFIGPSFFIYKLISGDISPSQIDMNNIQSLNKGVEYNLLGEIGLQFNRFDIGFRQSIPNNIFEPGLTGTFMNNNLYVKYNFF